ncbi:hypothetical protein AZE42_10807 [Rhizopogon vesiculosus]|uniref:Uncharacterized protein n=1 Tax=Rhizopogon vesiculosus TaxID=180088 RepID=A0A1J8Q353_9AGAM|nr:hypothetical protein AZE42_10807 [Rhizopogon vesiculosus]
MKWLWFTPTEKDVRQEPGCTFELGLLDKKLIDAFKKILNKAGICVPDVQKSVHTSAQTELAVHFQVANHSFQHLQFLPLPARDVILQVAKFQCILLDTFAIVQYETVALPSWPSKEQFQFADDKWMGVFTADPAIAQELYDLCIPFWCIRLEETFPLRTNIHLVKDLQAPPGYIVTHHPRVGGSWHHFPCYIMVHPVNTAIFLHNN